MAENLGLFTIQLANRKLPLPVMEIRSILFINYDGKDVNAAKTTESIQNIWSSYIIGMLQ